MPALDPALLTNIAPLQKMNHEAKRAVFVWSMGITQHVQGVNNVRSIINLALTKGFVGREGCGLMPIRGHSGVQGGAEMGAYATAFPGGLPVNPENATSLAGHWGFAVPESPGIGATKMIEAADRTELDVLFSVGGNFLEVLPAKCQVQEDNTDQEADPESEITHRAGSLVADQSLASHPAAR